MHEGYDLPEPVVLSSAEREQHDLAIKRRAEERAAISEMRRREAHEQIREHVAFARQADRLHRRQPLESPAIDAVHTSPSESHSVDNDAPIHPPGYHVPPPDRPAT